ncbi:MAG: glycosyltransferase family 4 protein [Candidatus Cloacimonadales bacterium]
MKVLIITYYWPPSGGAGVQRWLKFAKYLPDFGIEPTILTTRKGDYPVLDYSLSNDVDASLRVIRTATPTFQRWFGAGKSAPYGSLQQQKENSLYQNLAIWIRLNLIVPDARQIWNKQATAAARDLLSEERFDAVITTGPPHSTHLIGLKLQRIFALRWLADFRDPWCEIDYLKNSRRWWITRQYDRYLQSKVVQKCDKVISVNQAIVKSLQAEAKAEIISNGYDPQDFAESVEKNEKFTIAYFGLLSPERQPDCLIAALNKLYVAGWRDISLDFYGKVENRARLKAMAQADFINFHPYLPHQAATRQMQSAHLLLLVINNVAENEGIITGKIFEYIGSKTPILAIGPESGEAADILADAAAGKMFDYQAVDSVAEYIKLIYQHKLQHATKAEKYGRKFLSGKLAKLLKA